MAKIAVVQLESSKVGDFDALAALAQAAKNQGAELVIFPEASAFGWLNPKVFTDAQPIPGPVSNQFAEIARITGIWVATGLAERGPAITPGDGNTYQAYDSGILLNTAGEIVLHHRKHNVLLNAFDPSDCPAGLGTGGCAYAPGQLSDIAVADTPFGRTAILVCADAYTYDPSTLKALKAKNPQFVIIPWGVAASKPSDCGKRNFNATGFAAEAAKVLGTAQVVGANGTGQRPYGRFLPSWYCGTSGFAGPDGSVGGVADTQQELVIFEIPVDQ